MIPDKIPEQQIEEILKLSEQGQTQEQVAEKLGISRATVSRYLKKQKDTLRPKILRRFSVDEINSLCKLITPLVLQGINHHKEEEEMGDEVALKVEEALARKQILDTLNELTGLKDVIETNAAKIDSLCKQFPALCSTQETINTRLRQAEADKPKGVLGTDLSLGDMLKHKESQKNLVDNYMGPAGLLFALKRCTGKECEALREKAREQGINLQVKGEGGMLGSTGWKDID